MTITTTFTTIDACLVPVQHSDRELYDAVIQACRDAIRPRDENDDADTLPAADLLMEEAGLPSFVTEADVVQWDHVRTALEFLVERDGPHAPTYVLEVA